MFRTVDRKNLSTEKRFERAHTLSNLEVKNDPTSTDKEKSR